MKTRQAKKHIKAYLNSNGWLPRAPDAFDKAFWVAMRKGWSIRWIYAHWRMKNQWA